MRKFKIGFVSEVDMKKVLTNRCRLALPPETVVDDVFYSWPAGGYSLRLFNPSWPAVEDDQRAPTVPLSIEEAIPGSGSDERLWRKMRT